MGRLRSSAGFLVPESFVEAYVAMDVDAIEQPGARNMLTSPKKMTCSSMPATIKPEDLCEAMTKLLLLFSQADAVYSHNTLKSTMLSMQPAFR